jgi:hypothetical protein
VARGTDVVIARGGLMKPRGRKVGTMPTPNPSPSLEADGSHVNKKGRRGWEFKMQQAWGPPPLPPEFPFSIPTLSTPCLWDLYKKTDIY